MVVGGSRQENPDPGFGLLGTLQQGVLVILKELVLPDGSDPVSLSFTAREVTTELSGPMMVGGSRQGALDPGFLLLGTRQQGVLVILKELMLPDGFDPMLLSFTVRDVTTELSGQRSTSYRTET
ncbi:unnamed protein product [Schistosoma mattheei]|uniref:Uncharacterized protein n=1 Tax=Schistosoma mattheei TaxID=31246 RepID=A0A3P8G270_9TREM|nr:unnamed protein product [Schistosoma mattheei]